MLKIRLQRVGRKNDPAFRIVLTDSKTAVKKSGSFTKVLGSLEAKSGKAIVDGDAVNKAIIFKNKSPRGTPYPLTPT